MPDLNGFVKYHRQALAANSTLRKVPRADRATLLDYVALARWQPPFAGCLCDEDGTPWSRSRRAREVREDYATIKRTEDRLVAAGLVTFQSRGVAHSSSVGRLSIANFAKYQVAENPSELKVESVDVKAKTLQNRRENPSKMKGTVSVEEPFDFGGSTAQRLITDEAPADTTSDEKAFKNEGRPPQDVKKGTYVENDLTTLPAESLTQLRENVAENDLWLIDEFLDSCAAANTSGKITKGRRLNLTRELLDLKSEVGNDAWRYGMAQTNERDLRKPCVGYVEECCKSYPTSQAATQTQMRVPGDHSHVKTNEYGEIID